jgi:SAM-dependent methyltransferase
MTTTSFSWSAVAPAWDRYRAHVEKTKAPATMALLEALHLTPGERLLELGAGTGELAVQLAAGVAPGQVIASDVAPAMVALLESTLHDTANATAEQLDACALALPDASVDVVVFRMGLMLMEEPSAALREIRRVLRAGGRLGLVVWAGPEHNPWMVAVGMSAMIHGLVSGGPPTGPGGPFSLSDPDGLRALVAAAGFGDVDVAPVETPSRFADEAEHFETVSSLAGPLGAALATASADSLAAVRETTAEIVRQYKTQEGLILPGRALVCTAVANHQ